MGEPVRKGARDALATAPRGDPLTAEERARIEAVRRRGKRDVTAHELVLAELEERRHHEG